MIHTAIFNGDGHYCPRCGRSWDQGEAAPEQCERGSDVLTYDDVKGGADPAAMRIFWAQRYERMPKPDAMTRMIGGTHYTKLAIQPTEFAQRNRLDFCIGSILKYLSRWRAKNGVEDLRKARHFVEIRESFPDDAVPAAHQAISMFRYVAMNAIPASDAEALYRLSAYYLAPSESLRRRAAERLIEEIDRMIESALT